MRSLQLGWLAAAVFAASLMATGCSAGKPNGGGLSITASALSYSDIDHVSVELSGTPLTSTKTLPLTKKLNSLDWTGTLTGVAAGSITVTANAYIAGSNTPVFSGQINASITDGGTAVVTITMNEVTPSKYSNNAPVISAIQVSSKTVAPSGSIGIGVVATDPDGDPLSTKWTSSCGGSFSAATAASGTFNAPTTSGNCTLTVLVADNKHASTTATVQISVQSNPTGGVSITATPDLAPTVAYVGVSVQDPNGNDALFVAGNRANLTVSAIDDNTATPALTYAWQADCAGTFDSTLSATPAFTLAATTGTCTFTVTVTDTQGSSTSGTLTLAVQTTGIEAVAPGITLTSQSSAAAYAGGMLSLYVEYVVQSGHAATVEWTASTGTGTATDNATAFNSSYAWTTPSGLSDGTVLNFTVKITDNTNTLSVSKTFTASAASDQCTGKTDGTPCTGTDLCFGSFKCQGQVCVGTEPKDCSHPTDQCKAAGSCNPATGQCAYTNAANGAGCSDNKACTGSAASPDHCNGLGTCIAGAVNCPATTEACMQGGGCDTNGACIPVTPKAVTASCDDGLACTGTTSAPDHCSGTDNTCVHGADSCAASTNPCLTAGTCILSGTGAGTCSVGTPKADATCADADKCTVNSKCDAQGVCKGEPKCAADQACNPADGSCSTAPAPLCMAPQYGVAWGGTPTAQTAAIDMAGNTLLAGTMYALSGAPLPIGSLSVGGGAGANVYAAKLVPPTSGVTPTTLWAKMWGDDKDQSGIGVASSSGNVAVIGNYFGDMGITGLPANSGAFQMDFLVGLNASSGNPEWAKKIDLGGLTGMTSIYGNPTLDFFYVCGSATIAVADLNSTTTPPAYPNLTFGGTAGDKSKDIVVAKISAANGAVVWARQIGGAGTQTCAGVTADASNVYLTGTYQGSLDFGCSTSCAFPTVASVSRGLLWVAKLDASNGSSVAAKTWGTTGSQGIRSIALDPQSNVLVAGSLTSTIDFGLGSALVNLGTADAFLIKLDSGLNPLWAKKWGDAFVQTMNAVATDSSGNVFAVGMFNGSVTATIAGTDTTLNANNADMLNIKLNGAGDVICMTQYGDVGGDEANAIAINRFATGTAKDKGVLVGKLAGSVNFSTVPALSLSSPATTVQTGFAVGINPNSR